MARSGDKRAVSVKAERKAVSQQTEFVLCLFLRFCTHAALQGTLSGWQLCWSYTNGIAPISATERLPENFMLGVLGAVRESKVLRYTTGIAPTSIAERLEEHSFGSIGGR